MVYWCNSYTIVHCSLYIIEWFKYKSKNVFKLYLILVHPPLNINTFGRLEHVPVDIDGVRTFADFEVIEIVDDNCPYPALLGIDWAFNNSSFFYLNKICMAFEGYGLWFIAPLDPDEGH